MYNLQQLAFLFWGQLRYNSVTNFPERRKRRSRLTIVMKRILLGIVLILILGACSGDVYSVSYTARGDSTNFMGLTQTTLFQRTDDINVVIKLNEHDDDVEVSATFYNPSNEQEGETQSARANGETGVVVLGLDWETRPGERDWDSGDWHVEVRVDGELVEELEFRIN